MKKRKKYINTPKTTPEVATAPQQPQQQQPTLGIKVNDHRAAKSESADTGANNDSVRKIEMQPSQTPQATPSQTPPKTPSQTPPPQVGLLEVEQPVVLRLAAIDGDMQREIGQIVAVEQARLQGKIELVKAVAEARKSEIVRGEIVKAGGKYETQFSIEKDYSFIHLK